MGHPGTPKHQRNPDEFPTKMWIYQWPFQDPIDWRYLPYMFGRKIRPKFEGISPENMA